jgi:hypothetical protein
MFERFEEAAACVREREVRNRPHPYEVELYYDL